MRRLWEMQLSWLSLALMTIGADAGESFNEVRLIETAFFEHRFLSR